MGAVTHCSMHPTSGEGSPLGFAPLLSATLSRASGAREIMNRLASQTSLQGSGLLLLVDEKTSCRGRETQGRGGRGVTEIAFLRWGPQVPALGPLGRDVSGTRSSPVTGSKSKFTGF